MSFTGVQLGYGAKIRIGRGVTPTWTALEGCGDFDFPQAESDEVKVTSHSSPNRTHEYVPGFTENGVMTVPIDWVPGSDQDILLRVLQQTGEIIQIEATPAGAGQTAEVYAGFVKRYGRSAPVEGKSSATLAFRINGIISGEAEDPTP